MIIYFGDNILPVFMVKRIHTNDVYCPFRIISVRASDDVSRLLKVICLYLMSNVDYVYSRQFIVYTTLNSSNPVIECSVIRS